MAKLLSGAPVREKIKERILKELKTLDFKPCLAIVTAGDRADTASYLKHKTRFGEEIGVQVLINKFPEDVSEEELGKEVVRLAEDKGVSGIIVQLPLPHQINAEKIINLVPKNKDADGLTSTGWEEDPLVTPATARGVVSLLDFYEIEVKNKNVVVIGKSKLAGGPIAFTLSEKGANVKVFDKKSDPEEMKRFSREANILVVAAGQVGLINKEFVNKDQVVVDVGINRVGGGDKPKIVGDVDFGEVEPLVSAITPVPGGVGLLTVASLFQNLLDLAQNS